MKPRALARVALALLVTFSACRRDGSDERKLVRFWAFGREGDEVRALVPEFERKNPDLRVEVQQIPWTAAHEKLLTAFVGDATPDAAQLGNTWIAEFVALDALAPLDARVATSTRLGREDFFPGPWDGNVIDGETFGLPWYVDTRVLFYRSDLLAATGAPWPPKSWAEWRTAMDLLVENDERGENNPKDGPKKDAERYAILLPIDEWAQPAILGLQLGAPLLRDGGRFGDFRNPRFRRGMEFYASLYRDGLAPPLDRSGLANLYQQFAEGYFAMVITGPWNLSEFAARLPPEMRDRWATAPLPPPDAGDPFPGASIAGGSSVVVFRDAKNPDGAWRWIEYLAEAEPQADFYARVGDLPARIAAWPLAGLDREPRAAAFRVQLERALPLPLVPEWERIAARMSDAAEEIVRGGAEIDVALARLDADTDRMLAKRRLLLDRKPRESEKQP